MANTNGPAPKKKRSFKNPETFRERALKASEDKSASEQESTKRQLAGKALSPISGSLQKLRAKKQLKPIFKVLHFVGLIVFPKYFRSSLHELKKVTWPGFKLSRRLTYAVLIFAIIFGASVALIDYGFGKIFKHILLK